MSLFIIVVLSFIAGVFAEPYVIKAWKDLKRTYNKLKKLF